MYNLISFLGIFILMAVAWALSSDRKVVNWRVVIWGTVLQLLFALVIFLVPAGTTIFQVINDSVVRVLDSAMAGTKFLFGRLALSPGMKNEMGEDTMKDILSVKTPSRRIYLPVFNSTIACSTSHNPHQNGVIERPEAKRGSGEEYFLRLGRGKELCVACHTDIKTALVPGWLSERGADAPTTPENLVEHKPVSEQKCKACHAIDGPTDGMQKPVVVCVKEGCHDTRLLTNTRTHEVSVLKHCTFCHNPHSSRYKKLLYGEEDSSAPPVTPCCGTAGKRHSLSKTMRYCHHMRQPSGFPQLMSAASVTALTIKTTWTLSALNCAPSVISTSGPRYRSMPTARPCGRWRSDCGV